MKTLIDGLNYEELDNPFYEPSYFDKNIKSVQFFHNLAIIYKEKNEEGSNIVKSNRILDVNFQIRFEIFSQKIQKFFYLLMSNLKTLISLLRIKQWVKNIFVLSPFLISIELYSQEKIIMALIGFLSFSLISSFVYILNDVSDLNLDSLHPLKKKRPLPSGQISLSSAYVVSLILIIFGFLLLFFSEPNVFHTLYLAFTF